MAQLFVNNYRVTLTAPVLAAATNIPVSSTAGLPALAAGDFVAVTLTQSNGSESSWEVVHVTGYDAVSLTVVRAYEGAASDWPSGSVASARLTSRGLKNLLAAVNTASYTYDSNGRISTATESLVDGPRTTNYTYDASGRVSQTVETRGSRTKTTTYTYDSNNHLTSLAVTES